MGFTESNLQQLSVSVGEKIAGRTGGAVSLGVGMAYIFSSVPGMKHLMSYWYHFAIMFEALFILTTIDAGTRIGRFLLQEAFGKVFKPFQKTKLAVGKSAYKRSDCFWPGHILYIQVQYQLYGLCSVQPTSFLQLLPLLSGPHL